MRDQKRRRCREGHGKSEAEPGEMWPQAREHLGPGRLEEAREESSLRGSKAPLTPWLPASGLQNVRDNTSAVLSSSRVVLYNRGPQTLYGHWPHRRLPKTCCRSGTLPGRWQSSGDWGGWGHVGQQAASFSKNTRGPGMGKKGVKQSPVQAFLEMGRETPQVRPRWDEPWEKERGNRWEETAVWLEVSIHDPGLRVGIGGQREDSGFVPARPPWAFGQDTLLSGPSVSS